MNTKVLKTPLDYAIKAKKMGKKTISYSQISTFNNCPLRWKLEKIDRLGVVKPGIALIFGTAMHETIQSYLNVMYAETIAEANRMDLRKLLQDNMMDAFNSFKKRSEGDMSQYTNKDEMRDFYEDGVAILEFFQKKRGQYFSKKHSELVGIEMPIFHEVEYNSKVMFMGFMDLVIKEGDKIKIIDIKTSYMGWRPKKKKTEGNQLRLYKKFFAEQYDVDIKNIEVEYFIIKRRLYENMDFPQSRIQIYKPASGKPSINKSDKIMKEFVDHCFTEDGKYNTEVEYLPYKTDCKYCQFKNNHTLCPPKERLTRCA